MSTFDRINGASIAAWRLHRGLLAAGLKSEMRVQRKLTSEPEIHGPEGRVAGMMARLRPHLERLAARWARRGDDYTFSVNWLPGGTARRAVDRDGADLVHLHWVSGGFVPWGWLKMLKIPIVWTCHDRWPFGGAFHYPPEGRVSGCAGRLDRWQGRRKVRLWERGGRVLVAPSRWMAAEAETVVGRNGEVVRHLPNPIDTTVFEAVGDAERREIKKSFGFSPDRAVVLFGAEDPTDPRKGGDLLEPIAGGLREAGIDPEVVVFGGSKPADAVRGIRRVGWLGSDPELARAYAAADVFVLPSRMDNLPNTGVEAIACGTPVVASDVGGIGDIVENGVSGYTVRGNDVEGFVESIGMVLKHPELRERARGKALAEFGTDRLVPGFIALYRELLDGRKGQGGG